jgi:DNA-binding HxlR family transcriptional regulator
MAKSAKPPVACPIHTLLEVLARPWTLHILWTLSNNGPTRFGALRRSVQGISSRMLAERLRDLEREGFLFRDYQPTIPPSVTYGLTEEAKGVRKMLDDLGAVALRLKRDSGSSGKRSTGGPRAVRTTTRETPPSQRQKTVRT